MSLGWFVGERPGRWLGLGRLVDDEVEQDVDGPGRLVRQRRERRERRRRRGRRGGGRRGGDGDGHEALVGAVDGGENLGRRAKADAAARPLEHPDAVEAGVAGDGEARVELVDGVAEGGGRGLGRPAEVARERLREVRRVGRPAEQADGLAGRHQHALAARAGRDAGRDVGARERPDAGERRVGAGQQAVADGGGEGGEWGQRTGGWRRRKLGRP